MIPPGSPRRSLLLLATLLAPACGGAPPAAAPPSPDPPLAVAGAAPVAAPAVADVVPEPALAPGETAMVLRMASPARDLPVIAHLLPPGSQNPFAKLLAREPEELVAIYLGAAIAGAVDLARGADVALSPETESSGPRIVGSLALHDLEAARPRLEKDFQLAPAPGGALRLVAREGARVGALGADAVCEVRRAAGAARHRLICAPDEATLRATAPYLVGTVAREAPPASLRLEMLPAAYRELSLKTEADARKKGGGTRNANVLGEKVGRTLRDDVHTVNADLDFTRGAVDLGLEVVMRRAESPVTLLLEGQGKPAPPPEAFWRLPASSDLALFLPGAPPDAMRAASAPLWKEFMPAALEEYDVPQAKLDELARAAGGLFLTGGPVVIGYGLDRAAAKEGLQRFAKDPKPAGLPRARAAVQGWTVFELAEPIARWRDGLRDMLRLEKETSGLRRPKPAAPRAGAAPGAGGAASPPPPPPRKEERTLSSFRLVPIGAADKLPADSVHLVDKMRPNPLYKPETGEKATPAVAHEMHYFFAADGDHTWVACAEDAEVARARLRQVLDRSGTSTLRGRADLAALAKRAGMGGGFLSLAAVVGLSLDDESVDELTGSLAAVERLQRLPAAGAAPLLVGIEVTGPEDHRVVRATLRLPPAAVSDLGLWFAAHATGPAPERLAARGGVAP